MQSLRKISHWECSIALLAAANPLERTQKHSLLFHLLCHSLMGLVVKTRSYNKLANPKSQLAFNVSMVAPSLHSSTIQNHVVQDIAMVTSVLCWSFEVSDENNEWFNPDAQLRDPADILTIKNHACANASSCGSAAISTMLCFVFSVGQVKRCVRPTNGVFVCGPILGILRKLKAGGGTQSYRLLSEFISL